MTPPSETYSGAYYSIGFARPAMVPSSAICTAVLCAVVLCPRALVFAVSRCGFCIPSSFVFLFSPPPNRVTWYGMLVVLCPRGLATVEVSVLVGRGCSEDANELMRGRTSCFGVPLTRGWMQVLLYHTKV